MHLGIIGLGNIGRSLLGLLPYGPVTRVTTLVRHRSETTPQRDATAAGLRVDQVTSFDELLTAGPDLVVECAGHHAVEDFGPTVLEAGLDMVIVSVGALADETLHGKMSVATAAPGSGRMILPIGAIGGLDLLATLAPAGGLAVHYTGTKPPLAWKGTPAEEELDLDGLGTATRFFEGTAREAARRYPKNANVVAALALTGAGFEATRATLVADPAARGNSHAYEVTSPICHYRIEIEAIPSTDNPRTSATTVWSVLTEIRRAAEARRP